MHTTTYPAPQDVERMSSLQIAELTGKPHNDLMKAIRKMEHSWRETTAGNFSLSYYTDKSGKQCPMYSLTKTECLYIATKFNDRARAQLVLRWEELERARQTPALPSNYREALAALLAKEEERERLALVSREQAQQIAEQSEQLQAQAPKVLFAEAIMGSKTSCLIGELAKIITQNGYAIGANRLFKWLREEGYLGKKGEYYNMPNQRWMEQGLFEIKKGSRSGNDGVMHTTQTPKVTPKGQAYFIEKFLSSLDASPSQEMFPAG